jgi:hypothetical protein
MQYGSTAAINGAGRLNNRPKGFSRINGHCEREQAAEAYSAHPALLRLQELETLRALARTANARIYIGFDKHRALDSGATRGE